MEPEPKNWELKFGVEVSTRYHDWRRATLTSQIRAAKAATFVGAILTLVTAFNPLNWAPDSVRVLLVLSAVAIAVINLWELVAGLNETALKHTELYRRFAGLQEKIASIADPMPEQLSAWAAEAAAIRKDEPPTMWAVYAMCWNQTVERYHGKGAAPHLRRVGMPAYLLRNLMQFRPQDFPLAEA